MYTSYHPHIVFYSHVVSCLDISTFRLPYDPHTVLLIVSFIVPSIVLISIYLSSPLTSSLFYIYSPLHITLYLPLTSIPILFPYRYQNSSHISSPISYTLSTKIPSPISSTKLLKHYLNFVLNMVFILTSLTLSLIRSPVLWLVLSALSSQ